jgi:hypothetical protein
LHFVAFCCISDWELASKDRVTARLFCWNFDWKGIYIISQKLCLFIISLIMLRTDTNRTARKLNQAVFFDCPDLTPISTQKSILFPTYSSAFCFTNPIYHNPKKLQLSTLKMAATCRRCATKEEFSIPFGKDIKWDNLKGRNCTII